HYATRYVKKNTLSHINIQGTFLSALCCGLLAVNHNSRNLRLGLHDQNQQNDQPARRRNLARNSPIRWILSDQPFGGATQRLKRDHSPQHSRTRGARHCAQSSWWCASRRPAGRGTFSQPDGYTFCDQATPVRKGGGVYW